MTAGIKWIVDFTDPEAPALTQDLVVALAERGVPSTVEAEHEVSESRVPGPLRGLLGRRLDYDRVVVNTTPDRWPAIVAREPGVRCVGLADWGTDALPESWVPGAESVAEVWVPSTWSREVFVGSGVEVPVVTIPRCRPALEHAASAPEALNGLPDRTFVFYSILEWNACSNAEDLLIAYWSAFSGVRDVALVLVCLPRGADSDDRAIRREVQRVKREVNLAHYPRLVTLPGGCTPAELVAVHQRGHCFVLLGRGGGWAGEPFAAAARGNPVVACRHGAAVDYLNDETGFLVNVTYRPVAGMHPSSLYVGTQTWAQPDLAQAVDRFRQIRADEETARVVGERAAARIARDFSPQRIADRMLGCLYRSA